MQTTPETAALLRELYERASIVTELDGPQLEAWVSGLFTVFDEQVTTSAFVGYCAAAGTEQGALLVAAIAELTTGLDQPVAEQARQHPSDLLPVWAESIGTSDLSGAWLVTAPFGQSVVLGFDNHAITSPNQVEPSVLPSDDELDADEVQDLRHSILVELDSRGMLVDLQLTGPSKLLLDEAAASDDRVVVAEMSVDEAVAAVADAWPVPGAHAQTFGPGFDANQQFVRRRMLVAGAQVLPRVEDVEVQIDVRRGLDDDEFADANRAALSTLQAAVGLPEGLSEQADVAARVASWVAVIRGDVADVLLRESDALLWLEWADWLGAGIGMLRAGVDATVNGATLVDHVNRCPEVSSSIDKADREYAEWAFDVALDLLEDQGVVTEDRRLSEAGHTSLWHGLVAAWS